MSTLKVNKIENTATTDGGININSSGNVGVGTSSPTQNLHVHDSGFAAVVIQSDRSSGTIGGLILQDSSGNNKANVYGEVGGELVLGTDGDERVRILSSGGITFNGDTAAANALDDYEEGTWTPTWQGTLNSGTFAATGTYTKIGRTVTIQMAQTGGDVTFTAGAWIVGGLPFTPSNGQTGAAGALTDMSPSFGGIVSLQGSTRIYSAVAASNKTTLRINATFQV